MEQAIDFDDKAIEGLDLLFQKFWILRAKQPQEYQLIREREKVLRRYLDDKFGLLLIVHQHFIKLEKIPVEPESWMGITTFQEQRDYSLFCYALAFLEDKSVDEQFLLSELAEEIQHHYVGKEGIDWTIYTHRKSLIRAMKILTGMDLIRTVDGSLQQFDTDQDQEVLYETTVYSKYFIRSFPDDLTQFHTWHDLLEEDWKVQQEDERRKRVYRKLFFTTGVHRKPEGDADFVYIRNFRNRLIEDIENHSNYRLRLFKNTAFLSAPESSYQADYFPDTKASTDVMLHLSYLLYEKRDSLSPLENGDLLMTTGEFDDLLIQLKRQYGQGWAKYLREAPLEQVRKECIEAMQSWSMAEVDNEAAMIYIKPLFGMLAGKYPTDFVMEEEQ